jgi:FAD/FMN-containing dehydrogenase/Fe-S oxidoreductase
MTRTSIPGTDLRRTGQGASSALAPPQIQALERELARRIDGEVRFDAGTRAAYSTDASNFRQVPIGVVVPRTVEGGARTVSICRDHGVPLLSRGGGTSLAGQCTNTAVVIDWSKYCHRVLDVDPENRTATVEPGIVLDVLNTRLEEHGLRFGPEPATHMNCTLGGMIGNNSCGATAQRTGKVVDNVEALEVMLYDGTRFWCGKTSDDEYKVIERRGDRKAQIYRRLRLLRDTYQEQITATYPDIPRRVSGYNLDSLLPEHGFDIAGLLVGSESTLVTVLRAKLKLVPTQSKRSLVVLGYPGIDRAADAVPKILPHNPIALEGLDHRLIRDQQIKHMNPQALAELPEGTAFLMVQFGGDTQDEVDQAAQNMLDDLNDTDHEPDVSFYDDPAREDELWSVREAGLGATAHVPGHRDTWEGWEDSAVHPDRLGDYLRDLQDLYDEFGYSDDTGPSLYGHFGQGCVHTRIPFDLYSAEGVAAYRRFMERAAELVTRHGGSLSGEHGDGQSRGELLTTMFGEELVEAFQELKAIFDPGNAMNPGKVVSPAKLDEHLRLGGDWAPSTPQDLFFKFPQDGGSFAQAATRCVGVGKCRHHDNKGGTVMCPSYQVTMEEEHSTRGRARLLFEMLNGHGDSPVGNGWRSEEVKDALDLCLACKGCKTDCPANVDMATYKAEFLAHHWKGRPWRRPRSDWALGLLPEAARLVSRTGLSRVVNTVTHAPLLHRLITAAGGLENREVPLFAGETLQDWYARRGPRGTVPPGTGRRGTVLLWPDTFTNNFHPSVGQAAIDVLESAGWGVIIPNAPVCCALTRISTGQLKTAKKILRRTIDELAPHVRAGGYVVGLEPSCTAVFRADAPELFPDDQDVHRLRDHTLTLAELLTEHTPGWEPPTLGPGRPVLAQVHCHQHAVMRWEADEKLLTDAGADVEHLETGCCGLAGNFGFERGHGEVSRAIAERALLPRVREAPDGAVLLADGFSCRTQIHELAGVGRDGAGHGGDGGREAMHLAELLAAANRGALGYDRPEGQAARRPESPSAGAKAAVLAVATLAAAGTAGLVAVAVRALRDRAAV